AKSNYRLLIEQAARFHPSIVVISDQNHRDAMEKALSGLPVKVLGGREAIEEVVTGDRVDMVLAAMVGFAGLIPVVNAIKAGKQIALANKESLVVAGELVTRLAREYQVVLLPVDSEHSAIFQCLTGEQHSEVEKVYITASGGPFRNFDAAAIEAITCREALKHPTWSMGAKITIDSATLMNKGLEMIEARWLFNLRPDQIEVIVHPQSIVHSLVQFCDGSIKAQLGLPDMRLPILYAMSYPKRLNGQFPRFNFTNFPSLTFEAPDCVRFPNLLIAMESMRKGGNMPCIMNAANEIAVEAFLNDRVGFYGMTRIIEKTLLKATFLPVAGLSEYIESDRETRSIALSYLK
ncbi:MAG: 1-deoxy-D-xylulose-5-phosphate reductoisomerase, partial [Bacteroidia bacterium]|nr:1-deoxy-D-xylulose-5-phosphate reductoisomerase [Bacteroidia bacterium]